LTSQDLCVGIRNTKALVVNALGRGFDFEDVDVADTVCYVVTRPRRVAVNKIRVRPTEQEV
jgi:NADP-dependent 3-hydroxy acid dehydrogenase YdfG